MRRTLRTMRQRTCEICKAVHEVYAHMPDGKLGQFCSSECKKENAKRIRGKTCVVCSRAFVAKSAKQFNSMKCCSRKCAGIYRASSVSYGNCETCESELRRGQSKYCSARCSNNRCSVKIVRGAIRIDSIIESVHVVADDWDKAITKAVARLSSKNSKKADEWDKRITAAVGSLNERRRRGHLG